MALWTGSLGNAFVGRTARASWDPVWCAVCGGGKRGQCVVLKVYAAVGVESLVKANHGICRPLTSGLSIKYQVEVAGGASNPRHQPLSS
jgi:hypothetical protein